MKLISLATIVLISICQPKLIAQDQSATKNYTHKVTVDSILQTKAYTYLKVIERIKEKDSIQWLALPLFEPKIGDTYYFDSGLQMGEFNSKELNKTFKQIIFLGGLSTSVEISEKNIVPAPVIDTLTRHIPPVVHVIVVKEVLQTSGYTYLRVKEGNKEEWLAVVKIRAAVGQFFTFDDAAPMTDFTSKELKRSFKEILFLSKLTLSTDPYKNESSSKSDSKKKNKVEKKVIKTGPAQEVSSIASLLENKKSYSGKMVIIKGEVTKYSSTILDKNWI